MHISIQPSKKYFQKLIWLSFWHLHLDLYISSKTCNYVSCSFYLGKSNGDNCTIIRDSKNILWQDKARLAVSSKSRVDIEENHDEN